MTIYIEIPIEVYDNTTRIRFSKLTIHRENIQKLSVFPNIS